MGDTVINYEPINLDNDINEVNIGLYGKKFVDMTDEYVKEHQDYFKSILQISSAFYANNISGKVKENVISNLIPDINRFVRQSHLDGLYCGNNFKGEPYELNGIVDKNFMVAFCFGDDDFGGYIEDAINTWVEQWNTVVFNIKRYRDSDSEHMVKGELEKLDKLEDVTNLSKLLANSIVASYINRNSDRITDSNFKNLDTCFEDANDYVYDLGILNVSGYHKGSIKDITAWLNDRDTDIRDNVEEVEAETLCLNGEFLIIKVEKGYASACVR